MKIKGLVGGLAALVLLHSNSVNLYADRDINKNLDKLCWTAAQAWTHSEKKTQVKYSYEVGLAGLGAVIEKKLTVVPHHIFYPLPPKHVTFTSPMDITKPKRENSEEWYGTLLTSSLKYDYAIYINNKDIHPYLELSKKDLKYGDIVKQIWWPNAGTFGCFIRRSNVLGKTTFESEQNVESTVIYLTDWAGSSGSPLLDDDNRFVGLTLAIYGNGMLTFSETKYVRDALSSAIELINKGKK